MTKTQHTERVRLLALYPIGSIVKWNPVHVTNAAQRSELRVVSIDLADRHCNRQPWEHNPGCYTVQAIEYVVEDADGNRFPAKHGQIMPRGLDLERFVAAQVAACAEQASAAGEGYTTSDVDHWRELEIERLFAIAEKMAKGADDVERWDAVPPSESLSSWSTPPASGRAPELCRPCSCGCDLRGRGRRPLAGYLIWKRPGASIGTTIVFETEAAFLAAARTLSSARAWDHHAVPKGKIVAFPGRA